jgi:hypothetical protein
VAGSTKTNNIVESTAIVRCHGRNEPVEQHPPLEAFSMSATTRGRTAIVLVHGVGQQRPMQDLRTFVRRYLTYLQACDGSRSRLARHFSVPDRSDHSFELHSFVVPADPAAGTTRQLEFFEGYWAPDVTGTRWAHLLSWGRHLCLRSPTTLSPRVRWLWWAFWGSTALAGCLATRNRPTRQSLAGNATSGRRMARTLVPGATSLMTAHWALNCLGDAARYLDTRPDNAHVRFAIRHDVIQLLTKLHDARRYDNIIVVGHSLGAVVAYDALRLLWAQRTQGVDVSGLEEPVFEDRESLFRQLADLNPTQEGGKEGGKEASDLWRISDLVTVGAPLAHADLLLSRRETPLDTLIEERELPTCPPIGADDVPRRYWFPTEDHTQRRLHHGAVFAATAWTNLYAVGDFIGGPVNDKRFCRLGIGAVDHRIRRGWRSRIPVVSHMHYWDQPEFWECFSHIMNGTSSRSS